MPILLFLFLPSALGKSHLPAQGGLLRAHLLPCKVRRGRGAPAEERAGWRWLSTVSQGHRCAPHAAGERHPKGSGGGGCIPAGPPGPGLRCSPIPLQAGFPRARVPLASPGLCGGRHHPARPCGKDEHPHRAAPARSPHCIPHYSRPRASAGKGEGRAGREPRWPGWWRAEPAGSSRIIRPPAEPSSLPPPRLPWAFPSPFPVGLRARPPSCRLRFPGAGRVSPSRPPSPLQRQYLGLRSSAALSSSPSPAS